MPFKDPEKNKEAKRKSYLKHKEEILQKQRDRKEAFRAFKETLCCEICGESEPVCLDFHHLDPSQKDFRIAGARHRNLDTLMKEVEKCAVLCSNCHRKVHAGIIDFER